jgi:anti-sigma regulatory factor (Ser/Thr protein kinase)
MSRSSMGKVLTASGEMGRLIQSIDWSATPLGPIQDWPSSLRTAVGICLSCRFPLLIWWGHELVMLYNGAYRSVLGAAKHPQSMGARGADVWPECWSIIEPTLCRVLERGEATCAKDLRLLLDHDGDLEERYFTFLHSPIWGESGEVCGVFTLVTETTQRMLSERCSDTPAQTCAQPTAMIADLRTYQPELAGQTPLQLADLEHIAVAARYLQRTSGTEAGADWYDVVVLPEKQTLLAIGEVMDRGVQAASARGQLRNALRACAWQGMKPASILEQLNRLGLGEKHCSTALCLQYHARTGRLAYAAAGHPPPVLLRHNTSVQYLEGARAAPIGVMLDARYSEAEERLAPGDTLLLYTDALIASQTNVWGEGFAQLSRVMENAPADLDALVDHVLDMVPPEARSDDLAVLALRVIERPVFVLQRRWESRVSSLRRIRRELRAFLHSAGLREDDTDELIVAICEAAANAIEHPLKTTQPSIEVKVEVRDDEVVACVHDFGQWDDTDPEPDRGHGLPLIRTLVNVEVHRHVDGTRVLMRRVLRDRS